MPLDDRPIAARGGEGRATQPTDQRVTRARRQTKPPRRHVPDERGEHGTEHSPHRDDLRIDQTLPDRGSDRAAEKRSGQIEDCRHGDGLPRGEK